MSLLNDLQNAAARYFGVTRQAMSELKAVKNTALNSKLFSAVLHLKCDCCKSDLTVNATAIASCNNGGFTREYENVTCPHCNTKKIFVS